MFCCIAQFVFRLKPTRSFTLARAFLSATLLFILYAASVSAQDQVSHLRIVRADVPVQILDSPTLVLLSAPRILPGGTQSLHPGCWSLKNRTLLLDTACIQRQHPGCQFLSLQYRRLAFDLESPRMRLDSNAIRKAARTGDIAYDYSPYEPDQKPWESAGLNTSGAYTRGLSFGNNQNLVFNSNLNLQLQGNLGNDLEISGALSDNSIPLQPDGTTRQLQEFDRIFIQIKKKNTALSAGDFDLNRPQNSYFTNYFKRLQGGMLRYEGRVSDMLPENTLPRSLQHDSIRVQVAAAVSKGKFNRQLIQGQEGNQGPYRLQGAEGERFIIILAGTEKVFIDGQLLRRGLADDYVIDYNQGDISFTPKRLITKDIRIIVEFEYAVQSFLRSTLQAGMQWSRPKSRVYFNLYSEQDGRSSSSAQDLSQAARQRLASVGDRIENAFASGIDTLSGFVSDRVLYAWKDTFVCGSAKRILVYSQNPDSALYAARFSETPAGQGNYVLALSAANGRVYRWVAPDPLTCKPTGNFEPLVRLIAPEQRSLYTAGAQLSPNKGGSLQFETALSKRDYNRLSPLNDNDNLGGACFLSYKQNLWPKAEKNGWQSTVQGNFEYDSKHFQALNPYRPAEFVRDWNTGASSDTVAEQLARLHFQVKQKDWGIIRYDLGSFLRMGVYSGQKQGLLLKLQHRGFEWMTELNVLETTGKMEKTRYTRPKFELAKSFFKEKSTTPLFKLGLYAERERNSRNATAQTTLASNSFWYDLYRFYFQTPENASGWMLNASVSQRNDFFPAGNQFTQNTRAQDANFNGRWNKVPALAANAATQSLIWTFSYRNLTIIRPELTPQKPQETYLGRLDYSIAALKNSIALTTGYEIGSGQSPKIAFNYVKVNTGEGQYTWVDRNRDSLLQVDEMEIAVFQDQANYVRVAITTTEYLRTNNLAFNQNLRLEPRFVWGNKKGWRRVLSKFSSQSTLQINRRARAQAPGVDPWNPFQQIEADSNLISLSKALRNALFVNRANPAWDASITQTEQQSQVILTTGFEQRRTAEQILHGRINFGRQWSLESDLSRSVKKSENQLFNNRNFSIRAFTANPKISWLPKQNFRISTALQWRNSINTLTGIEKATQQQVNTEISWNPQSSANAQGFQAANALRSRLAYTYIRYTGQPNTALAFTMLEGLQNGQNYQWSLNLDRQLSKSMQLSVSYEGRKTGNRPIVHVARAQVRAVF